MIFSDSASWRLRGRAAELDSASPVVAYCAGGYRSSTAPRLLQARGLANVSDLIGGYQAWAAPVNVFVVHHQHPADRCPAADFTVGAGVLNYLSRPAARHGPAFTAKQCSPCTR